MHLDSQETDCEDEHDAPSQKAEGKAATGVQALRELARADSCSMCALSFAMSMMQMQTLAACKVALLPSQCSLGHQKDMACNSRCRVRQDPTVTPG